MTSAYRLSNNGQIINDPDCLSSNIAYIIIVYALGVGGGGNMINTVWFILRRARNANTSGVSFSVVIAG